MQQSGRLLPLALLAFPLALFAQNPVVSPSDRASLEGSAYSNLPLGRADARVQTLHLDVPGGTTILGHAYRRDAAGLYGTVAAFSAELEVTLSMSPNAPDQASPSFAANTGPNPVVVLPRTQLNFAATSRPATDPAPAFELMIPYLTPFVVPPQGGTLCVDVRVFGNVTPSGTDRNFNVYLDGHELSTSGQNEQIGYRYGTGCAPVGTTQETYGALSLWHLGTSIEATLALRHGIPEDGSGLTRAWVALGTRPLGFTWPGLPACTVYTSAELWFGMPGTTTSTGSYDGSYGPLPLLPPGYRLWGQSGTVHLGTGEVTFGDGVTVMTPTAAPSPVPARRIANSSDHTAATGSLSYSVPVIQFL